MSEQTRPWWASAGPVDGGVAPDEDPVERARAARRGEGDPAATGGPADEEPWLQALAALLSRLAEPAPSGGGPAGSAPGGARPAGEPDRPPPGPHPPDVCGVCPICVGLRTLAEARPELVGHLTEAARHVALAARALRERPPSPDASNEQPLEHIDLE